MGKEIKEGISIKTILTTQIPPAIQQYFNHKLLSIPYPKEDSSKIRVLIDFLIYTIEKRKYKGFKNTIAKYKCKIEELERIYETIKTKEEVNAKEQKATRASRPFYWFLDYGSVDEQVYKRFRRRVAQSTIDRKINSI